MKNLEDFKADAKVYDEVTTNGFVRKYRAFMDYMSRFIYVMLKDNEQEIISWLNNDNNERLLISVCTGGIHYVTIAIGLSDDKSHINIAWFGAHDEYYDPKINFNSTDKSILEFFNNEYNIFFRYYVPWNYNDDSIVINFVDRFNEAFYEKFESKFRSVDINDLDNFKKSKYALSFSDKKLSEIYNQIYSYYDAFDKIVKDSDYILETAKKVFYAD